MCYLLNIGEQIPEIFHKLDEIVYKHCNYNVSYNLYPTGYSTAYVKYIVTDPYKNKTYNITGKLIASQTYTEQIHEDVSTLLYHFIQPYIDLVVSDLLFTISKSPMKIALCELYLVMKTNSK